jgi:hypothetical protein
MTQVRIPPLVDATASIRLVAVADTQRQILGFEGPEWATAYVSLNLDEEQIVELTPTSEIATLAAESTCYLLFVSASGRRGGSYSFQVPDSAAVQEVSNLIGALDTPGNEIPGNGPGVTDHGALYGLDDDDHPQYFNETRGDARYYTKSATDLKLQGKEPAGTAAAAVAAHDTDARHFSGTQEADLASASAHAGATGNPHATTPADIGAEPAGTAAAAVAAHDTDARHFSGTQEADLASASAHAGATGNPHATTPADIGAEPAGTAAAAVAAHDTDARHFSGTQEADLASASAHAGATGNPHATTPADIGAEPAGTAAAAVAAHDTDARHFSGTQEADLASASAHAGATGNPHATTPADIGAATAAQGDKADTALQPADIASGAITPATGTMDFTGTNGQVLTLDASGNIVAADPASGITAPLSDGNYYAFKDGDWVNITNKIINP